MRIINGNDDLGHFNPVSSPLPLGYIIQVLNDRLL